MRATVDFTRPAFGDPDWTESLSLSAVTTRDRVRVHVDAEFATNLGVAHTRVVVHAADADSSFDLDYAEVEHQLPVGTSRLSHIALGNGLVMRALTPRAEYDLDYQSRCGRVEARMVLTAVTPPITGETSLVLGDDTDLDLEPDDAARPGRLDQLVSVKGDVRIDDTFYTIDCLANRGHRWRSAAGTLAVPTGYDELHFGDHLSLYVDGAQTTAGWPEVQHAYVVRKGELRKVRSASVVHEDGETAGVQRYEVTDESGEVYRVAATVRSVAALDAGRNRRIEHRRLDATWNDYAGLGQSTWVSDVRDLQRERRGSRRAAARAEERNRT